MCEKPSIGAAPLGALIVAGWTAAFLAQVPAFEAASIRPTAAVNPGTDYVFRPGGGFTAVNANVVELIGAAYGIESFRIVDGPDWVRRQGYDVTARAGTKATIDDTRLMLRRLLEERFRLRARMGPREMPVFALVRSRSDGRTAARLQSASPDACVDRGELPINVPRDALPSCGQLMTNPGRMRGRRVPIDLLATRLAPIVGRPVVNRTALEGMFDIDLEFAPENTADSVAQQKPGLYTALDEQLRLKLESTSAPVDVLVIESVERPTEN